MGAQKARRTAFGKTRPALQGGKKCRHGAHIKAAAVQYLQANAVGFTLVLPGVIQLTLHAHRGRGGQCTTGQLWVGSRHQNSQGHAGNVLESIAFLRGQHAGQMVLRDVANFMAQDAGQFRFAVRG